MKNIFAFGPRLVSGGGWDTVNSYTLGDTATGHWLHQRRYCIPQTTKYLHIQSVDSLRR